jgi:hypothetical protein
VVCTLVGTRLGERGFKLLEKAFHLYEKVKLRVDAEPASPHWCTLKMAVLNNQACIFSDFGYFVEAMDRLEQLGKTLFSQGSGNTVEFRNFFLTLSILGGNSKIAAAA